MTRNKVFSVAFALLTSVLAVGQALSQLAEGDLLFVAQPQGNAITQVTHGIDGLAIDHVAIVHRIGGEAGPLYVIEAIPDAGVTLTPIDSLWQRERGAQLLHARVTEADASRSVRNALHYVGLPYDDVFLPGDSAIYCSELVQLSYVNAAGVALLGAVPMSFHDASGRVTDYWTRFYADRGMPVPEGEPGSNPGELSRRSQVRLLHFLSVQW